MRERRGLTGEIHAYWDQSSGTVVLFFIGAVGLGFLQEMFGHGIHRLLWSTGIVLAIFCTWTLTMPAGNVEATGDQSPAPLQSQCARLAKRFTERVCQDIAHDLRPSLTLTATGRQQGDDRIPMVAATEQQPNLAGSVLQLLWTGCGPCALIALGNHALSASSS